MPNLFPAIVGSAASFTFGAVCGTVSFSLFTWLESGAKFNFSQALAQTAHYPLVYLLGVAFGLVGNALGGYVAARLSSHQPYLTALYASMFIMLWSAIMYANPANDVHIEIYGILSSFILPIPATLVGAYWYVRQSTDG